MNGNIKETIRYALDWLGIAVQQKIDSVFRLDDVLPNNQLLALIATNLGLKPLHWKFGSPAGILHSLGEFKALFLKPDRHIEVVNTLVKRH